MWNMFGDSSYNFFEDVHGDSEKIGIPSIIFIILVLVFGRGRN